MTNHHIEIERKFKVNKSEFNRIKDIVVDMATWISDDNQYDEYFASEPIDLKIDSPPIKWVSIRHRDGKHFLNYKKYIPEGVSNYTHSKEYESELLSPIAISKFMKDFGFKLIVTVRKRRIKFHFQGFFEIAFDEVEGLGYYIEIEALKIQETIENTNIKLLEFSNNLNLQETSIVNLGYPIQLLKENIK